MVPGTACKLDAQCAPHTSTIVSQMHVDVAVMDKYNHILKLCSCFYFVIILNRSADIESTTTIIGGSQEVVFNSHS